MLRHPTVTESIETVSKDLARSRRALPRCVRSLKKAAWHEQNIKENLELLEKLKAVPKNERDQPYYRWLQLRGEL